ncbi:MAG TPA: DUF92 domain-containing protein [Terriglobales bacterium]|nr:DUF92 domain-containing protein [Terriglobales bacterium]
MSALSAIVVLLSPVSPDGWHLAVSRVPAGLVVTAAFAVAARILRSVSLSGAIAGAAVTFLLWIAWPPLFMVELAVFVLTAAATRAGYRRKQQLGTAEKREGRSASQVLANLAVATACALLATYLHKPLLMFACAGALAEAAADTISSEMGQALGAEPVLLTTLRPVPVGTDGGVSGPGTLAGMAAALVVSGVAVLTASVPGYGLAIAAMAAVCGMFFDSLLGATLERRRILNNDQVNFSSTLLAAGLAIAIAKLWQ